MSSNKISWFGQVSVYVGKCFRLFANEKQWKSFISAAIITGIISLVTSDQMFIDYKETKNGFFAVICACVWTGLFNSIQSICRERAIIKREHRTGLYLSSYITAHAIYEAALCAVEALIILLLVAMKNHDNFPKEGLIGPAFLDMYITLFLVVFSADSLAILVSSTVRKENTAMTIMPFVLIVQLVMSGAVFPLKGFSEKISQFTVSKWGMDGVLRISNKISDLYTAPVSHAVFSHTNEFYYHGDGGFFKGDEIMFPMMDPDASLLCHAWSILLISAVAYLIISIFVLQLVDKDKRI